MHSRGTLFSVHLSPRPVWTYCPSIDRFEFIFLLPILLQGCFSRSRNILFRFLIVFFRLYFFSSFSLWSVNQPNDRPLVFACAFRTNQSIRQGLLDFDPFARIDEEGVGSVIKIALEKARGKQPGTKVKAAVDRSIARCLVWLLGE